MYADVWKLALVLLVVTSIGADAHTRAERRRRQMYRIVTNSSVPCEVLEQQLMSVGQTVRRVELTDDDKMNILLSHGGVFIPSLMAVHRQDAVQNFGDLLAGTLGSKNKPARKFEIVERLRATATNRSQPIRGKLRSGAVQPRDPLPPRNDRPRDTPPQPRDPPRDSPVGSPDHEGQSRGSRTTRSEGVACALTGRPVDGTYPYVLPEDIGISPITRNPSGYPSSIEYCIARGTLVGPEYSHQRMCTTCVATTTNSADIWPQQVNEALCTRDDPYCLCDAEFSGEWQGRCYESVMPLTVLRKNGSYCVLVLQEGEIVVTEEWVVDTLPISAGCECAVDSTSRFAQSFTSTEKR